jgi:hypothetical protein
MTLPGTSDQRSRPTTANSRSDQVYAIVRIDDFLGNDTPIEHRITVKKVMPDAENAEREAERLNRLQKDKGVRYFSQITRMERIDQVSLEKEPGQKNRSGGLVSGRLENVITVEKRAWLETIRLPEYIDRPPPNGWGFPAFRAYEVCANPSNISQIKFRYIDFYIFAKNSDDYTDVVGVQSVEDYLMVSFAFRVLPDLNPSPLDALTPLEIVECMADRFGLNMAVGVNRGKFFLKRDFDLPAIITPGQAEGQVIAVDRPNDCPAQVAFILRIEPPMVRVALAFAIDLMRYWEWIGKR